MKERTLVLITVAAIAAAVVFVWALSSLEIACMVPGRRLAMKAVGGANGGGGLGCFEFYLNRYQTTIATVVAAAAGLAVFRTLRATEIQAKAATVQAEAASADILATRRSEDLVKYQFFNDRLREIDTFLSLREFLDVALSRLHFASGDVFQKPDQWAATQREFDLFDDKAAQLRDGLDRYDWLTESESGPLYWSGSLNQFAASARALARYTERADREGRFQAEEQHRYLDRMYAGHRAANMYLMEVNRRLAGERDAVVGQVRGFARTFRARP